MYTIKLSYVYIPILHDYFDKIPCDGFVNPYTYDTYMDGLQLKGGKKNAKHV